MIVTISNTVKLFSIVGMYLFRPCEKPQPLGKVKVIYFYVDLIRKRFASFLIVILFEMNNKYFFSRDVIHF